MHRRFQRTLGGLRQVSQTIGTLGNPFGCHAINVFHADGHSQTLSLASKIDGRRISGDLSVSGKAIV
ncbi:hypothetical protein [Mycolicibacterium fortuitum]|uniref:hypothetical protein n=1 Tax=Mycolicibacterium fortuitum TaxID=1766 RepID=UPI00263770F5|nr:hypothetical protein [Mycolicibacterium fortuitum]